MSHATAAVIDLVDTEDGRRRKMQQKWRNRLNRAEALPLKISREDMRPDPNHWLIGAEIEQRKARKYKGLPANFTLAFARENPGQAQIFDVCSRYQWLICLQYDHCVRRMCDGTHACSNRRCQSVLVVLIDSDKARHR